MENETRLKNSYPETPGADPLVNVLLEGDHPVELSDWDREPGAIKKSFNSGWASITFTETRGQTAIGFRLDLSQSNLDEQRGRMHLEGALILNDVPVRCMADIDLATLRGTGRLVLL